MRHIVTERATPGHLPTCPRCGRTPTRGHHVLRVVRDGVSIGVAVLARADADRDLCPADAYVIERLWVAESEEREHIGTQLVHRACSILAAEGGRCLIAYGTSGRPNCAHLPASWLDRVGFHEHVGGVQWRIELDRTVGVRDALRAVERAWSTLASSVRGRPQPAGFHEVAEREASGGVGRAGAGG